MQKTLNVRFSAEEETKVVSQVFSIIWDVADTSPMNNFISWIIETSRGSFNETGDIECKSKTDYIGCHKKALTLGLLPQLSPIAVKSRFCYGK